MYFTQILSNKLILNSWIARMRKSELYITRRVALARSIPVNFFFLF